MVFQDFTSGNCTGYPDFGIFSRRLDPLLEGTAVSTAEVRHLHSIIKEAGRLSDFILGCHPT